jgi:hypothetical protein
MAWSLIEPYQRLGWQMGTIAVRTVKTSFVVPKALNGRGFNWYFDEKENVVKMQIEDKSIHKLHRSVCFPKQLRELFKDEQAVCYYDEDAIYFARYKDGQKKLVTFLKQQKVM